jgi:hypothetical protein
MDEQASLSFAQKCFTKKFHEPDRIGLDIMNCPSATTKEQHKKTVLGYRTFRGSACQRTFNERSGTLFNFLQYPTDIVLLVVLWRLRYTVSLRDLAEMFAGARFCVHP